MWVCDCKHVQSSTVLTGEKVCWLQHGGTLAQATNTRTVLLLRWVHCLGVAIESFIPLHARYFLQGLLKGNVYSSKQRRLEKLKHSAVETTTNVHQETLCKVARNMLKMMDVSFESVVNILSVCREALLQVLPNKETFTQICVIKRLWGKKEWLDTVQCLSYIWHTHTHTHTHSFLGVGFTILFVRVVAVILTVTLLIYLF
jgi:hypothetical protein